jgi:hypothetical protein
MHRGFRQVCTAFKAGLLATLLTSLLFFLIQAASFWTPTERIENHLRNAFETGALDLYDSRPFDSDLGYHQERDCLIYWTTVLRPQTVDAYLTAARYGLDPTGRATLCETLRDRLHGEMSADYAERPHRHFLHGNRALTAMVLSVAEVSSMRAFFKAMSYLLLIATIALAARQLFLSLAGRNNINPTRPIGSITIAASFSLFYGLSYFGQSPAHAPAAWVLFGFLLFATGCNLYRLSAFQFHAAIAVFGAWMAFFEVFTGALLIGLCLLLGLLAIQAHRKIPTADVISRSLLAPLVYLGASGLCLMLMLLLQIAVVGPEILSDVLDAFARHASSTLNGRLDADIFLTTDRITFLGLIDALIRKVGVLTAGSMQVGVLLVLMSLHLLIGALLLIAINGRKRRDFLRIGLCLTSLLPIVGWLLLFPHHTLTQSAFMVRILVWLPAAAGLAVTVAGEVCLARFQIRDYLAAGVPYFRGRG